MAGLVSGDAGVLFQLQHFLNHTGSKRRALGLMILVPHGKTILGLARLTLLEDVPLTVFRISKVGHKGYSHTTPMPCADDPVRKIARP